MDTFFALHKTETTLIKRRSRRFSQLKTRKSYNFETKPNISITQQQQPQQRSSLALNRSQSSLSNVSLVKTTPSPLKKKSVREVATSTTNTPKIKKSATTSLHKELIAYSSNSPNPSLTSSYVLNNTSEDLRASRLEEIKTLSKNLSATNMSQRGKHHTHEHHHYHHSTVRLPPRDKIDSTNSKNHVKAEYFNDEICSSSSISISSQVNGELPSRRYSAKNGRNVFNNLYNQGILAEKIAFFPFVYT